MGSFEEKKDEYKGRTKEAVGNLTDNEDLEREGKMDRAGSSVKGAINDTKEKAEDVVDTVKEKLSGGDHE